MIHSEIFCLALLISLQHDNCATTLEIEMSTACLLDPLVVKLHLLDGPNRQERLQARNGLNARN